jgi:hypothetical protein
MPDSAITKELEMGRDNLAALTPDPYAGTPYQKGTAANKLAKGLGYEPFVADNKEVANWQARTPARQAVPFTAAGNNGEGGATYDGRTGQLISGGGQTLGSGARQNGQMPVSNPVLANGSAWPVPQIGTATNVNPAITARNAMEGNLQDRSAHAIEGMGLAALGNANTRMDLRSQQQAKDLFKWNQTHQLQIAQYEREMGNDNAKQWENNLKNAGGETNKAGDLTFGPKAAELHTRAQAVANSMGHDIRYLTPSLQTKFITAINEAGNKPGAAEAAIKTAFGNKPIWSANPFDNHVLSRKNGLVNRANTGTGFSAGAGMPWNPINQQALDLENENLDHASGAPKSTIQSLSDAVYQKALADGSRRVR